MVGKFRCKPNPEVGVEQYETILQEWLLEPPARTLEHRIGTTFMKDARQVTPGSLTSMKPCMLALLRRGCVALAGQKFETALNHFFGQHPSAVQHMRVDLAHEVTNHVMAHLQMVRNIVMEDSNYIYIYIHIYIFFVYKYIYI